MTDVAITGLGIVSPLGESPVAVHESLCRGESGLGRSTLFIGPEKESFTLLAGAMPDFDAAEYLGRRGLRALNRIARMLTVTVKLALADAGWDVESLAQAQTGIVAGTMFSSAHTISEFDLRGLQEGPSRASPLDFANTVINAATGQAGIWHGLNGINSTISAGGSSGLSALANAADMIRSGRATILLAGGAEELAPEAAWSYRLAGKLCVSNPDTAPCPVPFHAGRNGFSLAEGAALLVLEDSESAQQRGASILARFLGQGSAFDFQSGNSDARNVQTAADAIEHAMRLAIADANLQPKDIDAVSCSANGSRFLDDAEAIALKRVFGESLPDLPVTAIKSSLGESLGAAGAIQALTMVMAIQKSRLPGIVGLEQVDSSFSLSQNSDQTRDVKIKNALVNSLDSSGQCWSAIIGGANQ